MLSSVAINKVEIHKNGALPFERPHLLMSRHDCIHVPLAILAHDAELRFQEVVIEFCESEIERLMSTCVWESVPLKCSTKLSVEFACLRW